MKRGSIFETDGIPRMSEALQLAMQHVVAMIVGCVTPAIIVSGAVPGGLSREDQVILIQSALVIAALSTLLQNNLPAGIICCTDIYNCANALLFHRIQQFYSVLIKLLIVIMCMCIKYHISLRGRRIFKNNVLNPPSQIKNVLSSVSQYLSHLFHTLSQGISWLSHPYPKVFHILIHIMWITCVTDTVYRCRILEIYIKQGR